MCGREIALCYTVSMKNTPLLYGIIGLLVGILATLGVCSLNRNKSNDMGIHRMPDGKMMAGNHMDSMMQDMVAGLEGKTGDVFDKEFLSEMIVHHQGAVVMAEMVLKTSKRPELIQLANDIIAAQTKEIGMMQDWQKNWFKE